MFLIYLLHFLGVKYFSEPIISRYIHVYAVILNCNFYNICLRKTLKGHDKSNEAILLQLNWYIHFIPGDIGTKEIHVYWQIPHLNSLSQANNLLLICATISTFLLKKYPRYHEFMVARRLLKKGGTFGKVKKGGDIL